MALCVQFGAACGLLVGHGVRAMVASIDPNEAVSLPLYAVCGAAAFLSGCVRYKATAILIAVESTGAWYLLAPVAVAGKIAAKLRLHLTLQSHAGLIPDNALHLMVTPISSKCRRT